MNPDTKLGDVLVIFPDDDSLACDRKRGYYLGASFGKVVEIILTKRQVRVNWLFAETYKSKLRPWFLPDGSLYSGVLSEHEIFTGDSESSTPLIAKLDSQRRLTKDTLTAIGNVLGTAEIEKYQ